MPTIAEKWVEKGMQQGMQQGKLEGIQQGQLEGLLDAIELGLSLKFGASGLSLMPSIRGVENIDLLEAVKEAIKVAKDLSEIKSVLQFNN